MLDAWQTRSVPDVSTTRYFVQGWRAGWESLITYWNASPIMKTSWSSSTSILSICVILNAWKPFLMLSIITESPALKVSRLFPHCWVKQMLRHSLTTSDRSSSVAVIPFSSYRICSTSFLCALTFQCTPFRCPRTKNSGNTWSLLSEGIEATTVDISDRLAQQCVISTLADRPDRPSRRNSALAKVSSLFLRLFDIEIYLATDLSKS